MQRVVLALILAFVLAGCAVTGRAPTAAEELHQNVHCKCGTSGP